MAGFKFKLQPFLNLKEQMEKTLMNEMGKAVRILEEEKLLLETKCGKLDECTNELVANSGMGVPAGKLKEYSSFILFLRQDIDTQKENVNIAQKNVDIYRDKLTTVLKERKVLEKLKDKNFEEFTKEQLKQEQKLNDEIVSFKSGSAGVLYGKK